MPPKSFRQMAQDGFAPINSALTFGPPTDLAAGWDGTLWAIDGSGAPHLYDPLGDSWQLHGTGIDGATQNDDVGVICFRGAEIFVPRSGPSTQLIGSIWPQLPPGYQLGVRGAASAADKIVLFRGGTYLTVPWPTLGASASGTLPSAAAPHTVGAFAAVPGAAAPPVPIRACRPGATDHAAQTVVADYVAMPLAGITGWPQTTNWQAGVIDGAYTQSPGVVLVIRGGEFVTLTFAAGAAPTASGPTPLSAHAGFGVLPPDWLATGFDGGFYAQGLGYFFKGAQAIVHGSQEGATKQTTAAAPPAPAPAARSGAAHTAARARRRGVPGAAGPTPRPVAVEAPANGLYYIPAMTPLWPPSWNPRFQHAPSGRAGGLWGATVEGYVVSSDGTGWTTLPGDAISVAAGVDGSVVAVPKSDPAQLAQWNGSGWATVAQHSSPLAQVSVGNQGLVWTRDAGNAVQQLSGGQLQPVPLAGAAAHIGANDDGTLWHCTGSDANALRLAPDLNAPSAAVAVAGTVQKVASTGFGAAHCLATQNGATQAYSYQSPYAFRTAGSYTFTLGDQIEQGLGNLYLVAQQGYDDPPAPPPTYQVVALDAHTGQELSRSATAPPKLRYTAPVFDPLHDTLIVGLTPYGTVSEPGQLVGLDARDLSRVRWSIALPDNRPLGPGRPTLQGTQLCVSDNVNTLLMYDTGATPDAAPVHRWTYQHPIAPQDDHRLPPPVIANGTVYAAWWLFATSFGFLQLWLWKLDAATGTALQTQPAAPFRYTNPTANLENWFLMGQSAPLLATLPGTQPGQPRQVLHVNGGQTVWGIDVDAATGQAYDLPGGQAVVTSGFGFADNVLWFGDGGGTLYGLDGHLATVPNTPASLRGNSDGQLLTTPVPYTDSQGNTAIILSEWDQYMALPGLLLFDPSSGNTVTIPTQHTAFVALSRTVSGGVIYGGGSFAGDSSGSGAQVFGLRVDEAVQELRAFVVESQLMQDFDDPSQPTHNPAGTARYRTQLTLLGDAKAPLANEAVKLWADRADTTVLVNGQGFTLGPGDDQYAAVQTGADGTLVIVSGSTKADGSDKADSTASPLRAWAAFMDPHERVLILPDREFHNRVATAHAADPSQAGADDPTRANLQTAQQYGPVQPGGSNSGAPLFSAAQKQQNQPQQAAAAIQQMTGAVGTAPAAGGKNLTASWARHLTAGPGKYIAYPDTPGGQYSPVNVAADRAAVVLQPAGISYTSNNDKSIPAAYLPVTPAAATLAIDALQGQDWRTSLYAPPRARAAAEAGSLQAFGSWDDFWDWLEGAAAAITHVIVAVAEDIYAGIRVLVDGVAYVFRAIITSLEEAISAIGAFFVQLGIEIQQLLEALSVIFQFGHIVDTHNILKAELLNRVNGVPGNAAYPGFAALMTGTVQPKLDGFFTTAEQTVTAALDNLADKLGGAPPTSLAGGGSTAHSAFTATPKGGGAPSSTGTQSTWGLQKLGPGIGGGSAAPSAPRADQAEALDSATDVILTFFADFAQSLSNDPVLSGQWDKVKQGAQSLSNAGSAEDFLEQALAELLRIVALAVDGVLAVGKALVDGLIGAIDALIKAMFDPATGVLTAPLDIPVLSWLYRLLFGEELTILNALMLVVAIPVTIMWKVVEGKWPAESWSGVAARPAALAAGALDPDDQHLMGYSTAIFAIIGGFLCGIGDAEGAGDVPLSVGRAALCSSLAVAGFSVPIYGNDDPSDLDWSAWGLGTVTGMLNILGSVDLSSAPESLELGKLGPGLLSLLSAAQVCLDTVIFAEEPPPNPLGDAALGLGIASALPGMINMLKLESEAGAVVVAVLDVVMGFAAGVAAILGAYANTSQQPPGEPWRGTPASAPGPRSRRSGHAVKGRHSRA